MDNTTVKSESSREENDVIFFIYDHNAVKREEDDPKNAILFMHPKTMSDEMQCFFCGTLMAIASYFKSTISESVPEIISLHNYIFAVNRIRDYSYCLGSQSESSDNLLKKRLDFVCKSFIFYHQGMERKIREFTNSTAESLTSMLEMFFTSGYFSRNRIQHGFLVLPEIELPKSVDDVFLKASCILESSQNKTGVLAGVIFHHNRVLCSQLPTDITRRLLLLKARDSNFPCMEVAAGFDLPGGIRLLTVFLENEELHKLKQKNKHNRFKHEKSSIFKNMDSINTQNTNFSNYKDSSFLRKAMNKLKSYRKTEVFNRPFETKDNLPHVNIDRLSLTDEKCDKETHTDNSEFSIVKESTTETTQKLDSNFVPSASVVSKIADHYQRMKSSPGDSTSLTAESGEDLSIQNQSSVSCDKYSDVEQEKHNHDDNEIITPDQPQKNFVPNGDLPNRCAEISGSDHKRSENKFGSDPDGLTSSSVSSAIDSVLTLNHFHNNNDIAGIDNESDVACKTTSDLTCDEIQTSDRNTGEITVNNYHMETNNVVENDSLADSTADQGADSVLLRDKGEGNNITNNSTVNFSQNNGYTTEPSVLENTGLHCQSELISAYQQSVCIESENIEKTQKEITLYNRQEKSIKHPSPESLENTEHSSLHSSVGRSVDQKDSFSSNDMNEDIAVDECQDNRTNSSTCANYTSTSDSSVTHDSSVHNEEENSTLCSEQKNYVKHNSSVQNIEDKDITSVSPSGELSLGESITVHYQDNDLNSLVSNNSVSTEKDSLMENILNQRDLLGSHDSVNGSPNSNINSDISEHSSKREESSSTEKLHSKFSEIVCEITPVTVHSEHEPDSQQRHDVESCIDMENLIPEALRTESLPCEDQDISESILHSLESEDFPNKTLNTSFSSLQDDASGVSHNNEIMEFDNSKSTSLCEDDIYTVSSPVSPTKNYFEQHLLNDKDITCNQHLQTSSNKGRESQLAEHQSENRLLTDEKLCDYKDELNEVLLYVQAHSETVMILMLEMQYKNNYDVITQLWKCALPSLGDLDYCVKQNLRSIPNKSVLDGYVCMSYDTFMNNIKGSNHDLVSKVRSDYDEMTVAAHEIFEENHSVSEILLGSQSCNSYSQSCNATETYLDLQTNIDTSGHPLSPDVAHLMDECIRRQT